MNDHEHTVFSASGCPPHRELLDYFLNRLSDAEKHRVEAHLVDCEMCSDELEGLAAMKNPEDLPGIVTVIETGVRPLSSRRIPVYVRYSLAAAAVILLLVTAWFLFPIIINKESPSPVSEKQTIPPPASVETATPGNAPMARKEIPPEQPAGIPPAATVSKQDQQKARRPGTIHVPETEMASAQDRKVQEPETVGAGDAPVGGVVSPVPADDRIMRQGALISKNVLPVYPLMDSAMRCYNRQEYRQAAALFRDILAGDTANEGAIYYLACCYAELKERKEALRELDKILADTTLVYFRKATELREKLIRE